MKTDNLKYNVSLLEKFGIYFLEIFFAKNDFAATLQSDKYLQKKVNTILFWSIISSAIVGIICVYPLVKIDINLAKETIWKHYGLLAMATVIFTIVEIIILFIISLFAVYQLGTLIPYNKEKAYLQSGPFQLIHILSRTALELNEPIIELFGIDPFQQISKRNLLVLSLIYKAKILLSNLIIKWSLLIFIGEKILGIPILYEAVLVEIFWNALIIYKVVKEARLRIFGFYIANTITENEKPLYLLQNLSAKGQEACIRAIANTVVMTKNYHCNMIILLFEFYEKLQISNKLKMDNWNEFITILNLLPIDEKYVIYDVLCISIAFDGKISDLELLHFQEAYGEHTLLYKKRIYSLIKSLHNGKINEAVANCIIDKIPG
jgi:hypothetical protein